MQLHGAARPFVVVRDRPGRSHLRIDEAKEVGGELVISSGDASMLAGGVPAERDDRLATLFVDQVVEAVGITGMVGEKLTGE